MVRNYVRKTEPRPVLYTNEDIFKAITAWRTKQMSLRQAAQEYKVPKTTLYNRFKRFKVALDSYVGQSKADGTFEYPDVTQEPSYHSNHQSPEHGDGRGSDTTACNQGELVIQPVTQDDKIQKVIYSKLVHYHEVNISDTTRRFGRRTLFGVDKEAQFERLILEKQASGVGLTKQDVCRLAFYFAESYDIRHTFKRDREMAGQGWLDGFLTRHPHIELRSGKGLSKESVKSLFESCLDDRVLSSSAVLQPEGNQIETVEHFDQPLKTAYNDKELVINQLGIVHSPTDSSEHFGDNEGWIDEDEHPERSCDGRNIRSAQDHACSDHQRTCSEGENADNQASSDLVGLYIKEETPSYSEPGVWNAALSPEQQTTCNEIGFTAHHTRELAGTNPCKRQAIQHLKCEEQIAGDNETVTTGDYHRKSTKDHQHCHIHQEVTTSSNIRTHVRKRSQCTETSPTKSHLDLHTKTHSANGPFQCTFCHEWYLTKLDLSSHTTKVHNEGKHYECSHCQKFFLDERSLKRHLHVHTEEKPHECPHCHMCFFTKQHLKRHIVLHTGEKPLSCQYCNKSFADKNNLNKHTTAHTGEELSCCPHCIKSFMTNSKLKQHMMKHRPVKPYKCSYCPKFFATKWYYTRHNLLIHTRERPNACSHCPKFFVTKSCLLNHMKTHTDGKSEVSQI